MELTRIKTSCAFVTKNASHVKINYEKIDNLLEQFDFTKVTHWLDTNPFDILNNDMDYIIDFLYYLHAIGDFCFWGDPKWSILVDGKKMDGSYAMIYLLLKHLESIKKDNLSYDEFLNIFSGSGELPFIKERYSFLIQAKQFLSGERFSSKIKNMTSDIELFDFIVSHLDFYLDEAMYKSSKVYFYKRAQLLTSDILHIKSSNGCEVDYSHLVGCADYKIPQALRNLGILEFSDDLAKRVDSGIPLISGSEEEVEIRSSTIMAIDYIAESLKNEVARMDINDCIWLMGQDKSINNKPYHKTLTTNY